MKTNRPNLKNVLSLSISVMILFSFTLKNSINPLQNKTFIINGNGFENIDRTSYELTSFEQNEIYTYGNFISFTDSTFHSYYRAECGNDCFTDVKGTYFFKSDSIIQIFVKTIVKSGKCLAVEDFQKRDFGFYKLIENTNSIILTRKN